MKMLPFFHKKRHSHSRKERLLHPIVSPRIEINLPDTAPLRTRQRRLFLRMLPNQIPYRCGPNLGVPIRDSAVGIGYCCEGWAGGGGGGLGGDAEEGCEDVGGGAAGGGVEDVAGYGVFGCHFITLYLLMRGLECEAELGVVGWFAGEGHLDGMVSLRVRVEEGERGGNAYQRARKL
jgi:hypothetical protein